MATAARAGINRLNAQSSTGPKTEEGKSRSSRNALSHGLTSKSVVLPHENAEEFEQMHQGLIESHRPANDTEHLLVESIAKAYWRMQRCYGVERAFLESRIAAAQENDPDIDPDAAMAKLFVDKTESSRVRLVMRYLATAERVYYKAIADLNKAQADRRRQAREDAQAEAFDRMFPDAPIETLPQSTLSGAPGFVSQPAAGRAMSAAAAASAAPILAGLGPNSIGC
jgi:hypothetical protein